MNAKVADPMVGFIPLKMSIVKGLQHYVKVMKQMTCLTQPKFVVSDQ